MHFRNLEINMSHPLIHNLSNLIKKEEKSAFVNEYIDQLYNNTLLVEGLLDNPLEMLPKIYRFMEDASNFHLKG